VRCGTRTRRLEGLAQAVGGNKAESPCLAGADAFGGTMPPVHDVVGSLGDVAVDRTERFRVAVAEFAAHSPVAQERRIANDKVGRGPLGPPGVDIGQHGAACRIVGNLLFGDWMLFLRDAVPRGESVSCSSTAGSTLSYARSASRYSML
jgi:hypothetical protein